MDRNVVEAMRKGFETAFVDNTAQSNLAYKPQFVWNNYKYGQKVLSSIEDELLRCDEFSISVAFITMSGITPLLQTLKVLEKKNIKGRILTTDYLTFTDPKALLKLMGFKNLEVRVYEAKEEGFHTKGYIFKQENLYRIITGSSNMTLGALTKNKEWNSKILSTVDGEYAVKIVEEFESLWNAPKSRECKEVIEYYTTQYNLIKRQKAIAKQTVIPNIEQYRLKPNKMQIAFTNNLQNMIHEGEDKALLISATG